MAGFNAAQKAAVTSPAQKILCLAGAGTGKTRVLTSRIAYVLKHDEKIGASNILALTFTRLAAGEMKERLNRLIGADKAEEIFVGTFHVFALSIIQDWGNLIQIEPNFTIYDEEDRKALITSIISDLGCKSVTYAKVVAQILNLSDNPEGDLNRVVKEYLYQLEFNNALDLDMILWKCYELLHIPEVREFYRSTYQYVFVDEYQDTSTLQASIIEEMNPRNLFIVGDDAQSIYGWRNANIGNILGFKDHYPETEVIKLEENYRSTMPIVSAANHLIKFNDNQLDKKLITNREGIPLAIKEFKDEDEELVQIATFIRTDHESFGGSWSDYAVLARTNAQIANMKDIMKNIGVPYQEKSTGDQIFSRPVVKGVLSFIEAATNPLDSISVKKAFVFPERRITSFHMEELELSALEKEVSLIDTIVEGNLASQKGSLEFVRLIKEVESAVELYKSDAAQLFKSVANVLDLEGYYKRKDDLMPVQDLAAVDSRMTKWQEAQRDKSIYAFLRWLKTKDIQGEKESEEAPDAVNLLTIHAAKGLEFDTVCIIGLNHEVFPGRRADIEEERRLMYVAITRAKNRLVISRGKERRDFSGKKEHSTPSIFLLELGL